MKTVEMKNLLLTKCMEMKDSVESKSSNKNPNYYSTLKEYRLWLIIQNLVLSNNNEDIDLDEENINYILQYTTNKHNSVIVNEGDDLLSLLEKYKDVKDIYNKIMKSCTEQNLKIDGNKIVKC